ncbi:hypothetical protein Tco_1053320 [Tanacetum coccineum]
MGTRTTEIAKAHKEAFRARRCLDRFIWEMSFVIEWDIPKLMNGSIATGDRLTLLEQDQIKNQEEIQCLKNQVHSTNISATLAAMDRDRREKNQDQDGCISTEDPYLIITKRGRSFIRILTSGEVIRLLNKEKRDRLNRIGMDGPEDMLGRDFGNV